MDCRSASEALCGALGDDVGGTIFTIAAIGWGIYEKWQRRKVSVVAQEKTEEARKKAEEAEYWRSQSQRPQAQLVPVQMPTIPPFVRIPHEYDSAPAISERPPDYEAELRAREDETPTTRPRRPKP